MFKCDNTVASVDIADYVDGLRQLVTSYVKAGYEAYLISFMFKLGSLGISSSEQQMREEIGRVYSRFLTECIRNPWSTKNLHNRPILITCPDWPVYKRNKAKRTIKVPLWDGVHWGGILLVPQHNRLKVDVKNHFESKRRNSYIRRGLPLSRIHVQHIDDRHSYVTGYGLKSLTLKRCSVDDLLIFP